MNQPDTPEDAHAYTDGVTGEKTRHRQVPMFHYVLEAEVVEEAG